MNKDVESSYMKMRGWLKDNKVVISLDGSTYCAHGEDFTNLQESKAGFGDTITRAVCDYLSAIGVLLFCLAFVGCSSRNPIPVPKTTPAPSSHTETGVLPLSKQPFYPDMSLEVAGAVEKDRENYLGFYLGMVFFRSAGPADAIHTNTVFGYSATSGELLKMISYDKFKAVFVDKTEPEYAP